MFALGLKATYVTTDISMGDKLSWNTSSEPVDSNSGILGLQADGEGLSVVIESHNVGILWVYPIDPADGAPWNNDGGSRLLKFIPCCMSLTGITNDTSLKTGTTLNATEQLYYL